MDHITILEGADLRHFFAVLGLDVPEHVYRVRIANDGIGAKVKVNEGMWSVALGRTDG